VPQRTICHVLRCEFICHSILFLFPRRSEDEGLKGRDALVCVGGGGVGRGRLCKPHAYLMRRRSDAASTALTRSASYLAIPVPAPAAIRATSASIMLSECGGMGCFFPIARPETANHNQNLSARAAEHKIARKNAHNAVQISHCIGREIAPLRHAERVVQARFREFANSVIEF
jgi:hypothetical protein